jgi:hypothetical protein
MRKRSLVAGLVVLAVGASTVGYVSRQPGSLATATHLIPLTQAASGDGCLDDRPTFEFGFAELKQHLGSVMGDPVECEHPIHANGDTYQRTTTGYAYYRTGANIPSFTDGWDHWALTNAGLVYWTGDVVDPPTSQSNAIVEVGHA